MPDFPTEKERREFIMSHADYFTVVRRKNMRYERYEQPTLEKARALAKQFTEVEPDSRWMIYAVYGVSDTWVETVPWQ